MAVVLPLPPVDLSGPPLLLGAGGDVRLLDVRQDDLDALIGQLASVTPDRPVGVRLCHRRLVEPAIAAGASLLHLDPAAGWAQEVRTAADAGAVVVFSGEHEQTFRAARDLLGRGGRPGRVVMEVPVSEASCPVDAALAHRVEGAGVVLGVRFEDPVDCPESDGWQIGMLTHLLHLGVRTVRQVPPARFRRVRGVVGALREARPGPVPRPVDVAT